MTYEPLDHLLGRLGKADKLQVRRVYSQNVCVNSSSVRLEMLWYSASSL